MKKILTCLLAVVLLAGCFNKTESKKNTSTSETSNTLTITNPIKLNSTKADMKGYKWIRNDGANRREKKELKDKIKKTEESVEAMKIARKSLLKFKTSFEEGLKVSSTN